MKRFLIFLVICIPLYGLELMAQEADLHNADTVAKSSKTMRVGIRLAPSFNSLDYGDLSFGQMGSDQKLGLSLGVALDWKVSEYYRYRLEPYVEMQNLVNNSVNPGIEAISNFTNIAFGLDALPLVLTYGNNIKGQFSAGGFAKYLLSTSQETLLNGTTVNANWQTNSLQYGLVIGAGAYFGRRLAELRYNMSLNDFVSNTEVPNSIRQLQLIIIF